MGTDPHDQVNRIPLEEAELVASSFGGLKPGNPVLRCALRILRGESIESIQPLHNSLKNANAKHWKERHAAAWALGRAQLNNDDSDSASGTLINVLENVFRERGRSKIVRWIGRALVPVITLALIAATADILMPHRHSWDPPWEGLLALFSMVIGAVVLPISLPIQSALEKRRNDLVRAAAARALAHRRHIEALGPLAGCLFDASPAVRQACSEALHTLLPAVAESDYGVVGADSVTKLGRALTDSDGALVVKALDALEKVGTSHAIPHVERLLKSTRSTLVRDRSQRVLDVLNARKRREAQGEGLLRAAVTPQDPSALLRPAQSADSEIEQLLRPAGDSLN